MIRKIVLAGAVLTAFAMPALAATEYYVAKDTKTNKCEVTTTKPDGKAAMEVGTKAYASKADADKAMAAAPECKS
jgi:hypothetical protein